MPKRSSRSVRRRARQSGTEVLSVTTLLCAASSLTAQTTGTKPETETKKSTTDLKEVFVDANVYNPKRLQSPKYTEPVRDIPQTVTIIPKQLIEDRGAFSLRDVLKNTPGISMQAGEGVSGTGTGDNLTIRGFTSRSDWFVDGMRDLATYNRDPFNTEQVEIAKGPASTTTGRGTTGGSINLSTKMAHLGDSNTENFTFGSSNLYRGTLDVNEQLSEHTSLRLNGMYHHTDIAGRDNVFQERYGIGASLATGLGTDTRFTLNYQRYEENNMPDFGIPWIPAGTYSGAAAGLQGQVNQLAPVSYNTFYGRRNYDYQKNQAEMITAIFEHDFSSTLKFRNTTRFSRNHYDMRTTAPRFRDTSVAPGNQYDGTLVREEQRRKVTNSVVANQSLLTAEFDTGHLKHSMVTGLELSYEKQLMAARAGNTQTTSLYDPTVQGPLVGPPNVNRDTTVFGISPTDYPATAESHLFTVSAYAFDTVKIGKHWQVVGGIRYDHIHAVQHGIYYTGGNDIFGGSDPGPTNNDDLFSWRGALIYKPAEHGTLYFGYGTSYNATTDGGTPSGLGLTTNGAAGGVGNTSFAGFDPEQATAYELGTKWDFFHERLSLTAALFSTEKRRVRTTNTNITSPAGTQTVDGVEVGLAGQLTKRWQVFAGAAHLASNVKNSSIPAEIGQSLPNTPDYTFNLWTSYSVTDALQVGAGLQYMGKVIGNAANPSRLVPDYWTSDLMVSYRFTNNFSLRLNVYNFTDERYIETSSSTGHVIPGPGRSAALTASVKF
ncbi:MAG: bfrD [Prosthecobacter sp.]|nr:bfrD [Prosthecobacter sp.]